MLNWRQILIHFLAAWFFMHAFQTLAVLHDTKLFDIINQSDKKTITKVLIENGITASDLVNFNLWIYGAGTIGLLVAFIISLTISIKKQWFWGNSLIVLVLTYLLGGLICLVGLC